jgi:hypothetical protein
MTRGEIMAANPLEVFVRDRGHVLKRARQNFVTNGCPVEKHKKPGHHPVTIDVQKQLWHCNDCDKGGTVIDWVMHERDCTAAEAMQLLGGGRNGDRPQKSKRRIVATYDYTDERGNLLYQVVRKHPKKFQQRRQDGKGGWIWNVKGVRRVLFRLPDVVKDVRRGLPIYLCPGEKDVLAMVAHGFGATTKAGGEIKTKWLDDYSETLRGGDVIIIADKDEKGRGYAQAVASKLHGVAICLRVIELPDVKGTPVKDPADFFAAGGSADQLQKLTDTAPEWMPDATAQKADIRGEIISIFSNDKLSLTAKRTAIGEVVTRALTERGRFFYHAERRDFDSAMFFDKERKRLERIRSDSFQAWLSSWLQINRADTVFRFITAEIETVALSGKHTTGIIPESFWASRAGAIYLSQGDAEMVKITGGGIATVANGTDDVLFVAGNTLAPWALVEPQDPFAVCSIFRDANFATEYGSMQTRLWILSVPSNPPCKPPSCLAGPVGAGKTRLAKGIAEFYGIPFVAHKVEEKGEDSFWVNLDCGGLYTLDNADTRNKWLCDAVAAASTDGCSQRRKLYTNNEKITLRARAWLCLTTANPPSPPMPVWLTDCCQSE